VGNHRCEPTLLSLLELKRASKSDVQSIGEAQPVSEQSSSGIGCGQLS
jgi:hypothetical protein